VTSRERIAVKIKALQWAENAIFLMLLSDDYEEEKEADKAPDKITAWCWSKSSNLSKAAKIIKEEIVRCEKGL
jgi:hypothetical protein